MARHPRQGGGGRFATARRGLRTCARTRPYRVVLVAVAAFAGRNKGRPDPLLRHGLRPYRNGSPGRRSTLASSFGASTADVDRAPPGPVRPTPSAAHQPEFSLVGRHQSKVAIELVAPMICKGAPPLVAENRRSFDRISKRPSELWSASSCGQRAIRRGRSRALSASAKEGYSPFGKR